MNDKLKLNKNITVFGAYGHTGKFVVAELVKRGFLPILSGRDQNKLEAVASHYPNLEIRVASVDDPKSIDKALTGVFAVINCAGPFLDTAIPIIEAALRTGAHYLDVSAEQQCVIDIYKKFETPALKKGVIVLPAMAFYGGLADLLATAAMGDWPEADSVNIGIALDSWLPTAGTRLTGKRNSGSRLIFSNKRLIPVPQPLRTRDWQFAEPFGLQDMVDFPLTEMITLSKHLNVDKINTFINLAPMNDIHDASTPAPEAADDTGRSSQIFMMEVEIRRGNQLRKARATGRDIYAITGPLIAEAVGWIAKNLIKLKGVVCAGEIFDAEDFLSSLTPQHLSVVLDNPAEIKKRNL